MTKSYVNGFIMPKMTDEFVRIMKRRYKNSNMNEDETEQSCNPFYTQLTDEQIAIIKKRHEVRKHIEAINKVDETGGHTEISRRTSLLQLEDYRIQNLTNDEVEAEYDDQQHLIEPIQKDKKMKTIRERLALIFEQNNYNDVQSVRFEICRIRNLSDDDAEYEYEEYLLWNT